MLLLLWDVRDLAYCYGYGETDRHREGERESGRTGGWGGGMEGEGDGGQLGRA